MTCNQLRSPNAVRDDPAKHDYLSAAKDDFGWWGNYTIRLEGGSPPRNMMGRTPAPNSSSIGALDILPVEVMIEVSIRFLRTVQSIRINGFDHYSAYPLLSTMMLELRVHFEHEHSTHNVP